MNYELGSLESMLIFTLERKGKRYFTVDDAREILNTSDEVVWKVLHKLSEKRRIQRIKRGSYLLIPARAGYDTMWREEVTSFIDELLDEYYVGYWTALNLWGMTEQIPRTLFIATPSRQRSFTYDDTAPVQFITLDQRKFFGWTTMDRRGHQFKVSDPEKTIVDSLDLPQYSGGITEIAKALGYSLDTWKLVQYADRMGNRTIHKRLGYLIETFNLDSPEEAVETLRSKISSGYTWLDPTAPKKVLHHNSDWNLKINVPLSLLRSTLE
jgi:predicted transcriptional regulator of viral defense system